jgi:hypothetical protein
MICIPTASAGNTFIMIPTTSAGDVQVTCITMTKQMSAQPKKWYRADKTKISGASKDRRMGPLASTERSLMDPSEGKHEHRDCNSPLVFRSIEDLAWHTCLTLHCQRPGHYTARPEALFLKLVAAPNVCGEIFLTSHPWKDRRCLAA